MDLQEKLNEVQQEMKILKIELNLRNERLKDLKSLEKSYLKLIEKAKALEK